MVESFMILGLVLVDLLLQLRYCMIFKSVGVEILPGLHEIAMNAREKYIEICLNNTTEIEFVCGSMFNTRCSSGQAVDWTDGDVVYANSTCYDDDMMAELSAIGANMRPGSYFITLSRTLQESDGFRVLEERRYEMSW